MNGYPHTWRSTLRGLAAVAIALLSALDAWVAAAIGTPPTGWWTRQAARVLTDAYRLGRYGTPSTCTELQVVVTDAEIVDEENGR
jgi:hypothetical protein